jgi:SAM-dependent methyltransferase
VALVVNPFGTGAMAQGYASARPPVHPLVIERARAHLPHLERVRRGLDVGCGAGLSTKALAALADHCVGLDPAVEMLTHAPAVAPGASFVAGQAETLPFASSFAELITAAGSLNYVDLTRFFAEAGRVLTPGGVLLPYDFSPGRSFGDSDGLGEWFDAFIARYPWPPGEARELGPQVIAGLADGFRLRSFEDFRFELTLSPEFYRHYVLTESNVAYAVRQGTPEAEIRSWCARTLEPVWRGADRDVVFEGYLACLVKET